MSPTRPQPMRLRSALVIVETEEGETMEMLLTPQWWQGVEATLEVEYGVPVRLDHLPDCPIYTVTLTAGGYHGVLRATQHTATQVEPRAVEP